MIAVFDTNIVIDALNGVPEADEEYGRYDRVLISDVTWLEILSGADCDDSLQLYPSTWHGDLRLSPHRNLCTPCRDCCLLPDPASLSVLQYAILAFTDTCRPHWHSRLKRIHVLRMDVRLGGKLPALDCSLNSLANIYSNLFQ